jgi:hypothetical protein
LAQQSRWKLDEAHLDDRHLVRRMILKRVVHGVDKNPMAVELAKVALWLHTFTAGAPLSFLDHHLRCGDSLLGLRLYDIGAWLQERGALPIHRHVVAAQQAAAGMAQVERITDSDIAEVKESTETFEGVREATEPLAAFLSLVAAERLMGVFDAAPKEKPKETRRTRGHDAKLAAYEKAAALQDVLDGNLGDPIAIARGKLSVLPQAPDQPAGLFPPDPPAQATLFARSALDPRYRRLAHDLVEQARALAREHRFLHWELAFPNVWQDWLSVDPKGGFDAVIGNPPYVRQEQIRTLKPALKKAYQAFDGIADLYVYFYELGLRLLRPGGRLSYVVTNKWLRAGYAEELRGLLSSRGWLEAVADFGHAKKFFPGADVFPCVIVARRPDGPDGPQSTEVCQIPRDVVRLDRVSQQVSEMAFPLPRASFTKQAWQLDRPEVAALMDKIRRAGVPLKDYAGVSPQYGIKTGYNEAFLIDTPTRDALVAADPKCADIIKPYLRGQDIERWYAPWRGLWMIFARRGIEIEKYPSVLAHLGRYRERLQPRPENWKGSPTDWPGRKPGNYAWYEIQDAVDYHRAFGDPKIIYNDITWTAQFSLDDTGSYINNTVYAVPTADQWILAVLNAPIGWWFAWRAAQHAKDEALRYFNTFMETYPIPRPAKSDNQIARDAASRLASIQREIESARNALYDWYRLVFEISKPSRVLVWPFGLSSDRFVEEIRNARGARRPLSVGAVHAVREEYVRTVQPMQASLREAERLEWHLSDLVNEAYGLTPHEMRLMWATAPPRMPLTPQTEALQSEVAA